MSKLKPVFKGCGRCKCCINFQLFWEEIGVCENSHSDHYRHVILKSHPACEKISPKPQGPET